ncbi:MAG: DNA helicase UvrD, partial [Ignavibacteriales bacterium]|nr:DNA helicase UvrD [Ignavibacteriales bacterium]
RLCYVGVTRAKDRVYLLHAFRRAFYGASELGEASRFLNDIPRELIAGNRKSQLPKTNYQEHASRASARKTRNSDSTPRAEGSQFRAGDKVKHASFGSGVVIASRVMGEDEEVEVAFVGKGVKKLLASIAGLKKS